MIEMLRSTIIALSLLLAAIIVAAPAVDAFAVTRTAQKAAQRKTTNSLCGGSRSSYGTPTEPSSPSSCCRRLKVLRASSAADNDEGNEEESDRLRRQASDLRDQIRRMEEELQENRKERGETTLGAGQEDEVEDDDDEMTLAGKRVLVVGANGRLGSMVCRYLLRNHPQTQVVASVHVVGENSPTSRGYARLSYEVGAEDGVGWIGPAWSAEERTATFEYDRETMSGYNLQNCRIVECEVLDPLECESIVKDADPDTVLFCATDFDGNQPRALSVGEVANFALLFRAVTRPDKGTVEPDGVRNMVQAVAQHMKQDSAYRQSVFGSSNKRKKKKNDPINFVLVSAAAEALEDLPTPAGTFVGLKRQGEQALLDQQPKQQGVVGGSSAAGFDSWTILQMSVYDDNFIDEGLEIQREERTAGDEVLPVPDFDPQKSRRRIHRRDAARAVVNAATDPTLKGKAVHVWTVER